MLVKPKASSAEAESYRILQPCTELPFVVGVPALADLSRRSKKNAVNFGRNLYPIASEDLCLLATKIFGSVLI
jgi:hypothetical protein